MNAEKELRGILLSSSMDEMDDNILAWHAKWGCTICENIGHKKPTVTSEEIRRTIQGSSPVDEQMSFGMIRVYLDNLTDRLIALMNGEKKEEENKWCEHIIMGTIGDQKGFWILDLGEKHGGWLGKVWDRWKSCPICGAKRP